MILNWPQILKLEIRNSKQFLNDERQNEFNVPNKRDRNQRFEFSEFRIYLAAICFGFVLRISGLAFVDFFRISILDFRIHTLSKVKVYG